VVPTGGTQEIQLEGRTVIVMSTVLTYFSSTSGMQRLIYVRMEGMMERVVKHRVG
jgi:hypothetical protein